MTLYIVSVPIGNMDDITKRAIDTFKRVDFLICEEFKIARKLLKYLNIDTIMNHSLWLIFYQIGIGSKSVKIKIY